MPCVLLAAGWNDFLEIIPIVIALLVWVISRFAGQVPQKPPQRGARPVKPVPPQTAKEAKESLQTEIDQFLQQARAARENRAMQRPGQTIQDIEKRRSNIPVSGRPGSPQRQRPTRTIVAQPKREPRRDEGKPTPRPQPSLAAEVAQDLPQSGRGSVAQHVAEMLDNSQFAKRAAKLSQVQQSSDDEFRSHMQRVFEHDVGRLKDDSAAAIGTGSPAGSGAAVSAAAPAAAASIAPVARQLANRKVPADIALLLANRRGMRDAVILKEILERPEYRW